MMRLLLTFALTIALANAACKDETNCKDCLSQKFCGWCSPSATVFNDGRQGSQCQDQHESGWHCNHLYSTDTCLPGYVCDPAKGQCHIDPTGGTGDTKENCEKNCKPTPTGLKTCNVKSSTCEDCKDYCKADSDCPGSYCSGGLCHGSTCQQASKCNTTCSADTPDVLLGVWRGLQIQQKFGQGEYDFKFQKKAQGPQVSAREPTATDVSTGSLLSDYAAGGRDLTLKFDQGPLAGTVLKGAFDPWEPSPETEQTAFYFGAPGDAAPQDIHVAMNGTGATVYAMSRCGHGALKCDFDSVFPSVSEVQTLIVDPCNPNKNCSACIGDPSGLCGWCSTDVVYKDGTAGAQCAGFDKTGTPLGWQCHGQFDKSECSDYACDWSDVKNPKCTKGLGSQTKDQCSSGCKPPVSQYTCNSATKKCEECNMHYCTSDKQCPGSYCNIQGAGPWSCHGAVPAGCQDKASCTTGCGSQEQYALCDAYAGKCTPVPAGTPNATTAYDCAHNCVGTKPLGTYRAVAINSNFVRGEYDLTFYDNDTMHWRAPDGKVSVASLKGSAQPVESDAISVEGTVLKSDDATIVGKKIYSLFKRDDQGNDSIVKNIFMGFSFDAPVGSFDAAMAQLEWVHLGCKNAECNFDAVVVP